MSQILLSETTSAVREVWEEALGRQDFEPSDNFFALGGNSLLATMVAGRLSEIFDHRIPLRLLAQNPTQEKLAAALTATLMRE
jgi:glutamate racemase